MLMLVLQASVYLFNKQWKRNLKEILQRVIWNAVWTLNCPTERCISHHDCIRRLDISYISLRECPILPPKRGEKGKKRKRTSRGKKL